ncbi:rod-determining factor RdfA [Haloplanus halobius]|uniref:rod-determining factor RdfA n=1 Tax=Haloplanus halobius TaxID=2934938 RepID=UPI00200C7E41|nr:rod-determining factor RdfA [Haloplanus sp. XH21]
MSESKRDYKVGRLIEKYSLDGIEDELAAEWTRDDDERSSLRELADEFNRRILRVVLRDANINPHERDIQDLYHVLTDDDVSSGVQVQSRRELEQDGVEIDELESDFITYQAVYNFLQDYCDTTYQQPSDEEQVESDLERINRLISRTRAVAEDDLERLSRTGRITLGEHDVFVDVQVYCQECDTQYPLSDLLTSGSCDCGV